MVEFEDEWDELIKNYVKEKVKKWRLKKLIKITLFGLHEKRGKVNTIPVPGYRTVFISDNPNFVGVARIIRIAGKDISVFIKALRRYIRKKFKV